MRITPCNYNYNNKQKVSFEKVVPLIGESEEALNLFKKGLSKKVGKKYTDSFKIQPLNELDYTCLLNSPHDNLHKYIKDGKKVHLLLTGHNAVNHKLDVQTPLYYRDTRPLNTWEDHELHTAARLVAPEKRFRTKG